MKYKHLFVLGMLLLVISCATVEPARIENGLFINPANEFSLRVPAGWETSKKVPQIFKPFEKRLKIMFSDLKNESFIFVQAEKSGTDWISFKLRSDKSIAAMEDKFVDIKEKTLNMPGAKYCRYEIYKEQIKNCDNECLAVKMEVQDSEFKGLMNTIFYKSNHDKLYWIAITLMTREEQYATSLSAFKIVVNSFQHS